ncbi:RNA polymerase sigma factor [Stieleria neptunia]|uniref:RNA polymerase sigma factor n=1 Tax=Stieleria neptunia TaxID=2527979 RepID=A0A518HM19_9BACT|nr:sigma-70 family RNA polymerase sigma factor [Stieleria neptunia]QDV41868.1 RNA polymerase sigma factor [Stieleria neptunia]
MSLSVGGDDSTKSGTTASGLIRQLCDEDPHAWARFADLYTPMVYRWSRRANLQMADAQEVTEEVFRVVSTRLKTFTPTGVAGSFRAWLWGINRMTLIRHFERLQKTHDGEADSTAQARRVDVPELLRCDVPPDDDEVSKGLLFRMLRMIRDDFEETTWQAFWQTTIEDQSATDVGRDLAMTANAVRRATDRVLRRMREEMKE